ncbi:hypothetical protein Bbelb_071710 [Branchiostoma belcheri]|nr:hypothetical protein Bbelb_071710 [Branchiostoma belcheri]
MGSWLQLTGPQDLDYSESDAAARENSTRRRRTAAKRLTSMLKGPVCPLQSRSSRIDSDPNRCGQVSYSGNAPDPYKCIDYRSGSNWSGSPAIRLARWLESRS